MLDSQRFQQPRFPQVDPSEVRFAHRAVPSIPRGLIHAQGPFVLFVGVEKRFAAACGSHCLMRSIEQCASHAAAGMLWVGNIGSRASSPRYVHSWRTAALNTAPMSWASLATARRVAVVIAGPRRRRPCFLVSGLAGTLPRSARRSLLLALSEGPAAPWLHRSNTQCLVARSRWHFRARFQCRSAWRTP